MIFKPVNLDWLSCIKKFEVSWQVVNMTRFNNIQKRGFEFEFKLKPRYTVEHCKQIVEIL
jgi:hypothetical protein